MKVKIVMALFLMFPLAGVAGDRAEPGQRPLHQQVRYLPRRGWIRIDINWEESEDCQFSLSGRQEAIQRRSENNHYRRQEQNAVVQGQTDRRPD